MRIKNKDIAEALGISTTAVSLALNNKAGVSEETRRKVLEMVQTSANDNVLLQKGNPPANKTIVLSIHKKLGLIINEKPFFSELIGALQQEAMENGLLVALANYMPGQNEKAYFEYLRQLNPAGIIIMATEMELSDLELYQKLQIPLVIMDSFFEMGHVDSISLDDQAAFYRSVAYAYEMGHRNIGFLKSTTRIQNLIHHFDGYLKGLRDFGLLDNIHPVIELPCTTNEAYKAMAHYLNHLPDSFKMPTIFIADLDYLAIGAMQALSEHGFRIPEDISMIGYDDILASSLCDPPLTTTHVNHGTAGKLAVRRIMELIEGKENDYCISTHLSSNLVIRNSVKKINI